LDSQKVQRKKKERKKKELDAHPRNDLSLSLLAPLGDLGVDLIADLGLNLTSVTGKEGKESLGAAVDHINLVEGDGVDELLPLLQLAVGARNKLDIGAGGIIVTGPGEGPPQAGDLSAHLVNRDNVPTGKTNKKTRKRERWLARS